MELLGKTVFAYKDSISRTIQVFQHHDIKKMKSHYLGTVTIGQKLYEYLLGWPDLERRLRQAETLYIIPDEFLYEVPFSTLIAKSSDSQTFLVNYTTILTIPSASFLPVEKSVRSLNKPGAKKVLISADKRFPTSEKFVAKVKDIFPLTEELTVKDSVFTKDDVLARLLQGNYQVYIFVGHGAANPQYPDHGYIELSVKTPNKSTPNIIRLTVADLKKINWLGAEMVMLVGCETAGANFIVEQVFPACSKVFVFRRPKCAGQFMGSRCQSSHLTSARFSDFMGNNTESFTSFARSAQSP
jgi:CHAT domain-containing protein